MWLIYVFVYVCGGGWDHIIKENRLFPLSAAIKCLQFLSWQWDFMPTSLRFCAGYFVWLELSKNFESTTLGILDSLKPVFPIKSPVYTFLIAISVSACTKVS